MNWLRKLFATKQTAVPLQGNTVHHRAQNDQSSNITLTDIAILAVVADAVYEASNDYESSNDYGSSNDSYSGGGE